MTPRLDTTLDRLQQVRMNRSSDLADKACDSKPDEKTGKCTTDNDDWWNAVDEIESSDEICSTCATLEYVIESFYDELTKNDRVRLARAATMLEHGRIPGIRRYEDMSDN